MKPRASVDDHQRVALSLQKQSFTLDQIQNQMQVKFATPAEVLVLTLKENSRL